MKEFDLYSKTKNRVPRSAPPARRRPNSNSFCLEDSLTEKLAARCITDCSPPRASPPSAQSRDIETLSPTPLAEGSPKLRCSPGGKIVLDCGVADRLSTLLRSGCSVQLTCNEVPPPAVLWSFHDCCQLHNSTLIPPAHRRGALLPPPMTYFFLLLLLSLAPVATACSVTDTAFSRSASAAPRSTAGSAASKTSNCSPTRPLIRKASESQ